MSQPVTVFHVASVHSIGEFVAVSEPLFRPVLVEDVVHYIHARFLLRSEIKVVDHGVVGIGFGTNLNPAFFSSLSRNASANRALDTLTGTL